jgi:hypothetical protein
MASRHSAALSAWENLKGLLARVKEDVDSQVMRLEPNIDLLSKFNQTYLANGVIDDQTYLVDSANADPIFLNANIQYLV